MTKANHTSSAIEARFNAVKPIPKKEALKLRSGDIIQVKWMDSTDSVHVVSEKPDYEPGELYIRLISESWVTAGCSSSQVVAVLGKVQLPQPLPDDQLRWEQNKLVSKTK